MQHVIDSAKLHLFTSMSIGLSSFNSAYYCNLTTTIEDRCHKAQSLTAKEQSLTKQQNHSAVHFMTE